MKPGRVALERALSKLGLASRSQARKLILDGRVTVDGKICRSPLQPVVPEARRISVDGVVAERATPLAIALHKTKGTVTTRSDEKGRPTVYDLLKDVKQHLVPVGRLDFATTGLLLLTNDTRLSSWLTDPANAIPRVYVVTVRGLFTEDLARRLEHGLEHEEETLSASRIEILKTSGRESHLKVELVEGKNREIRRMLSEVGHEVTRLKRISFGALTLGDLEPGRWREVSTEELDRAFPARPRSASSSPSKKSG